MPDLIEPMRANRWVGGFDKDTWRRRDGYIQAQAKMTRGIGTMKFFSAWL